jgi:enoyl-[acyl-carrier protein] reductase I
MQGMLAGKRALVQGVANKRSICWGIARALRREGAAVCLTYQNERFREGVEALAAEIDAFTLPLDVQNDAEIDAVFAQLGERWGGLDALVHGAAFARADELSGEFLQTTREGFHLALDVSAYSLIALVRGARPLFAQAGGGAVLCMTYVGSQRVTPNYNVMGVAKAALEACVRYVANDLGPENVRVNAISAGPVRTLAASGVRGLVGYLQDVRARAPLRRNTDPDEIGDAAVYLLSPLARGTTGHILYVDSGHHILGA